MKHLVTQPIALKDSSCTWCSKKQCALRLCAIDLWLICACVFFCTQLFYRHWSCWSIGHDSGGEWWGTSPYYVLIERSWQLHCFLTIASDYELNSWKRLWFLLASLYTKAHPLIYMYLGTTVFPHKRPAGIIFLQGLQLRVLLELGYYSRVSIIIRIL